MDPPDCGSSRLCYLSGELVIVCHPHHPSRSKRKTHVGCARDHVHPSSAYPLFYLNLFYFFVLDLELTEVVEAGLVLPDGVAVFIYCGEDA